MWSRRIYNTRRMNTGTGWVVYENGPPTLKDRVLALFTLFLLFGVTLAYAIITPLIIYLTYTYQSVLGSVVIFAVFLSPFLARQHWPAFGSSFGFKAWRKYFELRVYKEERFQQSKNVLLCYVPHGLFPMVLPMLSDPCHDIFPEFQGQIPNTAIADIMLWTPVIAPILIWLGCISAKKESMRQHLRKNNVMMLPDGIAGAYHSQREEECVYIQKRKGFIRLAIEEGSLLVPIYCFGHSQLYDVYPRHDSWIATLSRKLQFSLILFWGVWWCPPIPHRVPILVAVGKGIHVEKNPNPTQEQVDMVHNEFVKALKQLYHRHQGSVPGYENKELIIHYLG